MDTIQQLKHKKARAKRRATWAIKNMLKAAKAWSEAEGEYMRLSALMDEATEQVADSAVREAVGITDPARSGA
jgi:hypothetical protein